jgi:hypothetical protein
MPGVIVTQSCSNDWDARSNRTFCALPHTELRFTLDPGITTFGEGPPLIFFFVFCRGLGSPRYRDRDHSYAISAFIYSTRESADDAENINSSNDLFRHHHLSAVSSRFRSNTEPHPE